MIQLASPYFLLLIPLLLIMIFKKQKHSGLKFSSILLLDKTKTKLSLKHRIGKWLIALSIICFVIALARPQTEKRANPVNQEGVDIGLLLDVSGSMESVDFEPNRLEVARKTIRDFVKERPEDRMAFIVFGGSAYTKIPLTLDHHILEQSIDSVNVDSVNEEGTAIGMALSVGINRLKKSEAQSKILILVTDGDNNAGAINPITASDLAKELGIKVYTIGVGTDKTILPYKMFGETRYQQVEGGLNEELLTSIADTTGGKYYRAKDTKALEAIFNEINDLVKTDFEYDSFKQYKEWSFLFMGIGLCLLLVGSFLDRYKFIHIP